MAVNEERIHEVTQDMVMEAGHNWEDIPAFQQFLLLETSTVWEKRFQAYNARHNIVEAQVDDSIFGFDGDEAIGEENP